MHVINLTSLIGSCAYELLIVFEEKMKGEVREPPYRLYILQIILVKLFLYHYRFHKSQDAQK